MYVAASDDDRCRSFLRNALASGRDTDGLPQKKGGIQNEGTPLALVPISDAPLAAKLNDVEHMLSCTSPAARLSIQFLLLA